MFDFLKSLFKPKPYPTPVQWQIFALRHPELAKADTVSSVRYDGVLSDKLYHVNIRVNQGIKPRAEKGDTWSLWPEYGDCDDYAVTKRSELVKIGLPIGALRLAICKTEKGEGHAVLVVVTDKGEYVLDNRRYNIMKRNQTGYTWVAMSTADPKFWIKL